MNILLNMNIFSSEFFIRQLQFVFWYHVLFRNFFNILCFKLSLLFDYVIPLKILQEIKKIITLDSESSDNQNNKTMLTFISIIASSRQQRRPIFCSSAHYLGCPPARPLPLRLLSRVKPSCKLV